MCCHRIHERESIRARHDPTEVIRATNRVTTKSLCVQTLDPSCLGTPNTRPCHLITDVGSLNGAESILSPIVLVLSSRLWWRMQVGVAEGGRGRRMTSIVWSPVAGQSPQVNHCSLSPLQDRIIYLAIARNTAGVVFEKAQKQERPRTCCGSMPAFIREFLAKTSLGPVHEQRCVSLRTPV